MKVVILAGGYGTRLSEETHRVPKPMVEIGGWPILWHIMKIYSAFGLNDFVICLGYKGYLIKEYFANFYLHRSDVKFDMTNGTASYLSSTTEPWQVTLIDTGEGTNTGGRIRRISPYVDNEPFCLTYGDGLSDVDISALIEFHRSHGRLVTVTSIVQPGRFGALDIEDDLIKSVREKPPGDGSRINGGFFVVQPEALEYIGDDLTIWEVGPLEQLAAEYQLAAFRHDGFWKPMDTLAERNYLEDLWAKGNAPWKCWD